MSRAKGTANLAASLEVLAGAPLDAREKVPTKADLYLAANFPYPYVGLETYVASENKKYRLIGNDVTVEANWEEVGSGGGGGQEIQKTTLPTASAEESGNIYQYVGTNAALVKGGFYECVLHGATYQWDLVDTIGITSEIRDFAMSSYTYGSCDSESDLIDALNEFESYRSELSVVSSNVFYGSCWVDTTFDDMPHGTIIKAVYDTDAGWLYKGYDPNSTMEFTIVPTGTAPDIEAITVQSLAVSPMPAADMSEVVTPLPSVMSRRFKYSTTEQVVGEWIDGKPIYQTTVSYGALPNAAVKDVSHGISNIDKIISYYAISSNASGVACNLPCATGGGTADVKPIGCTVDKTNIHVWCFDDRTAYINTYVTIQYTKTTD